MINAGFLSDYELTNSLPYITLIGELCCVFCEYFGENWPYHEEVQLYLHLSSKKSINAEFIDAYNWSQSWIIWFTESAPSPQGSRIHFQIL